MNISPIGEIIESGTTAFVAQCLKVPVPREPIAEIYDPPPLGAFVKISAREPRWDEGPELTLIEAAPLLDEEDPFAAPAPMRAPASAAPLPAATYALVYGAATTSLEPNRRPSALGFADEDELRREQPQIFELLRTEFFGLLIAHAPGDGKPLRRHLPPMPPRIHSRVYPCTTDEVRALTDDLSFLRSILTSASGALSSAPTDELVAACLRGARDAQTNDQGFLLRAGRTLAALLAEDYDRLQAILRSVI